MKKQDFIKHCFEFYGISPDYPFNDDFDTAVLRHPSNGKWFALVMKISRSKLGLDSDEMIWVINLKQPLEMIGAFSKSDGVYPAYHMNKLHWISVVLDDAADETVKLLTDLSYEATKCKR